MPREVFVAGQILTAAEMNIVSDQTVMVFAGTAARGSAIPSPSEGMVTYREDDDVVEVFNGSSFVPVGPGQILQVVSTIKTDAFSTTSTSFVDVTGLSASITPTSASSKVLALIQIGYAMGATVQVGRFNLVRNSTAIAQSTAGSGRNASLDLGISASVAQILHGGINFLDSPATTSATTYKIQATTTGSTIFVNRKGDDAVDGSTSSITLLEVAG